MKTHRLLNFALSDNCVVEKIYEADAQMPE